MNRHRLRYIIVFLVLILVVLSLSASAKKKQRIVCLAPSCVETIYALRLEDSLVGWSQYTDYPPEATEANGWVPYYEYEFVKRG